MHLFLERPFLVSLCGFHLRSSFPFSIWFPEGVRNQIELAPSYHSNCDSEFVVTEKTYWCIKHVSRRKFSLEEALQTWRQVTNTRTIVFHSF